MPASPRILIVDGDARFARGLVDRLVTWGHDAHAVSDADAALQRLADPQRRPHVLITETHLPPVSGAAGERGGDTLLRRLPALAPGVVPLVLTGYGTIADAVAAVKLGVMDYLTKPLVDDALRQAIDAAAARHTLLAAADDTDGASDADGVAMPRGMVGHGPAAAALYRAIAAAADGAAPVLVTGEPGVGKDLAARAVHAAGRARGGRALQVHTGAGAESDFATLWTQAAGGTVLFRGIDRLSSHQQTALLAWLQSDAAVASDVRLIATAGPGVDQVLSRSLLDRVAGVRLVVPALRERPDDLDVLADHFLKRACGRARRERALSPAARRALAAHAWPGNVRELAQALDHAATVSRHAVIGPDDLPQALAAPRDPAAAPMTPGPDNASDADWTPMPLAQAMLAPERRILIAALDAHGWNRNAAARDLCIDRTTLYKKIKRFGLDQPGAGSGFEAQAS